MQGLDGDLGHSDGVVVGVGDIQDILGRKARRGCRWPSLQKADPSQVPDLPEYLPWHQDRELMKTNVRKFFFGGGGSVFFCGSGVTPSSIQGLLLLGQGSLSGNATGNHIWRPNRSRLGECKVSFTLLNLSD